MLTREHADMNKDRERQDRELGTSFSSRGIFFRDRNYDQIKLLEGIFDVDMLKYGEIRTLTQSDQSQEDKGTPVWGLYVKLGKK